MMKIPLYTEPLPLQPGPQPKTDFQAALQAAVLDLPYDLTRAPSLLKEWVGREDLLALIDQDWLNPLCRIVGLIGFAGEGKTTLARHWVDRLLDASSLPAPNGVFWWGFYENNSVDEFFEAALLYLSGGQLSFENLSSSLAKANFLAGMLRAGRYLFILDGIETLQHQNGDEYGLIRSNDLFEFLNYFSATQHESFCLITSRAPLYDLIHYITYTQRDVNRLSERDGRELLRKIGVQGTDEEIDQAVTQWDGHALTLSLLGLHVVKRYRGFINCLPGNLIPLSGEPKDERIGRLLRRYDEHLTETERCFLLLFSAFRKPVTLNDLSSILKQNKSKKGLTRSLALLKRSRFIALVKRLAEYRLLRKNEVVNEYTIHPLIRAHYLSCLQAEAQDTIQKFYLSIANYYAKKINLQIKTLADSAPHIEAIYYFCQAEEYNQGFYFWMSTLRFEGISVLSGFVA